MRSSFSGGAAFAHDDCIGDGVVRARRFPLVHAHAQGLATASSRLGDSVGQRCGGRWRRECLNRKAQQRASHRGPLAPCARGSSLECPNLAAVEPLPSLKSVRHTSCVKSLRRLRARAGAVWPPHLERMCGRRPDDRDTESRRFSQLLSSGADQVRQLSLIVRDLGHASRRGGRRRRSSVVPTTVVRYARACGKVVCFPRLFR